MAASESGLTALLRSALAATVPRIEVRIGDCRAASAWAAAKERKLEKLQMSQRSMTEGLDIDLSDALSSSEELHEPARQFLDLFDNDKAIAVMRSAARSKLASLGYTDPQYGISSQNDLFRMVCTHDPPLDSATVMADRQLLLGDMWVRHRLDFQLDNVLSYQLCTRLVNAGSWTALGEARSRYMSVELARDVRSFFERKWKRAQQSANNPPRINVVEISWLMLQNPLATPSPDRPMLPGQRFPGLGLSAEVGEALLVLARKTEADAFTNGPLGWHNSLHYARHGHRALSPAFDAFVSWSAEQLAPAIKQHGMAFVSHAWVNGHVRRRRPTGVEPEYWEAEDQAFAIDGGAFDGYFASREYQTLRQRALDELKDDSLYIDVEAATELYKLSLDSVLRERAAQLSSETL